MQRNFLERGNIHKRSCTSNWKCLVVSYRIISLWTHSEYTERFCCQTLLIRSGTFDECSTYPLSFKLDKKLIFRQLIILLNQNFDMDFGIFITDRMRRSMGIAVTTFLFALLTIEGIHANRTTPDPDFAHFFFNIFKLVEWTKPGYCVDHDCKPDFRNETIDLWTVHTLQPMMKDGEWLSRLWCLMQIILELLIEWFLRIEKNMSIGSTIVREWRRNTLTTISYYSLIGKTLPWNCTDTAYNGSQLAEIKDELRKAWPSFTHKSAEETWAEDFHLRGRCSIEPLGILTSPASYYTRAVLMHREWSVQRILESENIRPNNERPIPLTAINAAVQGFLLPAEFVCGGKRGNLSYLQEIRFCIDKAFLNRIPCPRNPQLNATCGDFVWYLDFTYPDAGTRPTPEIVSIAIVVAVLLVNGRILWSSSGKFELFKGFSGIVHDLEKSVLRPDFIDAMMLVHSLPTDDYTLCSFNKCSYIVYWKQVSPNY